MGVNFTGLTGVAHTNFFERLPGTIDNQWDILTAGINNLYYQEVEQLRLASPLIKSSVEVLTDFLNGQGWETEGDRVVNDKGQTTKDILNLIAIDAARWSGAFAIHVNFGLDSQGAKALELQRVPVEYIRLRVSKRADGLITEVAVSNNWENSSNKGELKPENFKLLNPLTAAEETIKGGKGQVLFHTNTQNGQYPLATYDSILDTAITDATVQRYEQNNSAKGFHQAVFLKWPAPINSQKEEEELKAKVELMLGAQGSGIQVVTVGDEFTADLVEVIEGVNQDDLFTSTLASIKDRVLSVFQQPPALLGQAPENVFSSVAFFESYQVYNVITRNKRDAISRAFNKVTALMGFSVGRLLENDIGEIKRIDTQSQNNGPLAG